MPLQATSGAASYDAFGGGVAAVPNYIEDVFSTWLYTGNGSTQTINNGIDLAGKGGLVWIKDRSAAENNSLFDTARAATNVLYSNTTGAQASLSGVTSFSSSGFSLGGSSTTNGNGRNIVSWTFRKAPKFFDVVTFTGNGSGSQFVNHNLQSSYGFIVIKRTDSTSDWFVLAKESSADSYWQLKLNSTAAYTGLFGADPNTNTGFFPSSVIGAAAVNGGTYVAYLFAHNAGGFGLTGTDNVISCGSFTTDGSANATVNLGYEPQWVLSKRVNLDVNWQIVDNMRGFTAGTQPDPILEPNTSRAEQNDDWATITSTGFTGPFSSASQTYIYIAIRRGPMKVPTSGTSVLGITARTGTSANATVTGGAGVTDLAIIKRRNNNTNWVWTPRLTNTGYLSSNLTAAEVAAGTTILQANPWDVMDGVKVGTTSNLTNESSGTFINYLFDRAPSFMDVVCYTGTGSGAVQNVAHNLTVVPEMMIVKCRSASGDSWIVYHSAVGNTRFLQLNSTAAFSTFGVWNNTTPTASVFTVGNDSSVNVSGGTYVNYLFASCPGVSKVGSFTGTGATQVINCGFTGGARFVLIKATSTTGNWLLWDSARGIVAGNDSYLVPNATTSEVTGTDWVDTAATGFELSNAGGNLANSNGVSYVFFAVA